ncbi:MAG: neuraminidase-like domain-containing protein [Bacteroidales bacterium]|nr:neuraminidase-like domain-containing protein [Bacteroidales bacterium]
MKKIKDNIQNIEREARIVGATISDWQLYKAATEINNYFRLDNEAFIFALLKKGVKPNIAAFFRISKQSMCEKAKKAVEQKIIPDIDIEFKANMIKLRTNSYLVKEYGDLFKGIDDADIKDLTEEEKHEIYIGLTEYALENKELDDNFFKLFDQSKRVKFKDFFAYRDICAGYNSFINLFVKNSQLQSIDDLLKLRNSEITAKINSLSIKNKDKLTKHITRQIEKKYLTRSLVLQLCNYNLEENDPIVSNVKGFGNFTKMFKHILSTKITVDEYKHTFNIQKDIARDYIEQLMREAKEVNKTFKDIFSEGLTQKEFINIFTIIQRLFFLTRANRFEMIIALMQNNYNSAYDVIKKGRQRFLNTFISNCVSEKEKEYVCNAAEAKINKVLALLGRYSKSTGALTPETVKSPEIDVENNKLTDKIKILRMPELKELFGTQDVLDVDHADSVFSSAAYLVDLLNLLKQIDVNENDTLYSKLIERRPDIAKIPLDCKNTLTLVPYIDLIIELLEYHIANLDNEILVSNTWDTTKTAEELKIEPEHCNYEVYAKIVEHYTWQQTSFNLKSEEARLYTQAMNIDRAYWANLFNNDSNIIPFFEILGMHLKDQDCFKKNVFSEKDKESSYIHKVLKDISFKESAEIAGKKQQRLYIRGFLDSTGLTLTQFEELLDSYTVNPLVNKIRHIVHYEDRVELKNAYLEFSNLDDGKRFVFRTHQYNRLLKATGWNIVLLDFILAPINYKELINSDHIEKLAFVKRMQNQYKLSNEQVELLFGDINIHLYKNQRSYIDRLFFDNDFPQSYKERFIDIVNKEGIEIDNCELYQVDGALSPFANYILSVLGFNKEEFNYLKFLIPKVNKIDKQAIENLVRSSLFVSHLGISIEELDVYLTKKGKTYLDYTLLSEAFEDFILLEKYNINLVNLIKLDEVIYENSEQTESSKQDEKSLEEIVKKIFNLVKENEKLKQSDLDKTVKDWLIDNFQGLENLSKEKITYLVKNQLALKQNNEIFGVYLKNKALSYISEQEYDYIIKAFDDRVSLVKRISTELNVKFDILKSLNYATDSDLEKSIEENKLIKVDKKIVKDYFKKYFSCRERIYNYLDFSNLRLNETIKKVLTLRGDNINLFSENKQEFLTYLNNNRDLSAIVKNFIHPLCKAMKFVSMFNLNEYQLEDYFKNKNNQDIDIFKLENTSFINYIILLYLLETGTYLRNNNKIFSLLSSIKSDSSDKKKYKKEIVSKLKIEEKELSEVSLPSDTLNCVKWLIELGKLGDLEIAPNVAIKWVEENISVEDINKLKEISKQVLGKKTYADRVMLLRNRLREKQRDALVNYYLDFSKTDDFKDSSDIFSYLLIDSQMTPAVSTSRIVQATLAIQLLIQRIQFNLEKDITLDPDDKKRWVWMSLYRVWEANRKIFVYPENWLEPELRDDKSPFFKDIEKELNNNDATSEAIEQSYDNYLSEFSKIADIEYCQMFNEEVDDNYSILHVVGRSKEIPHTYYYRKFVNESYWTPWEALDLDINSEHIAPVVVNERLILFWLEYEEAAEKPDVSKMELKADAPKFNAQMPKKKTNLQVCWSEFKNEKWSTKKISKDRIVIPETENGKLIHRQDIRLSFMKNKNSNELLIMYYYGTEDQFVTEERDVFEVVEEIIPIPTPPMIYNNFNKPIALPCIVEFASHKLELNSYEENPHDVYQDLAVRYQKITYRRKTKESFTRKVGEINYVNAFKCKIETFSNVVLDVIPNKHKILNVAIPDGMVNFYQKLQDYDGNISFPVNGSNQLLLNFKKNSAFVIYPHQYLDFRCQSPFIVEQGGHSLICIPNKKSRPINDMAVLSEYVIQNINHNSDNDRYEETKLPKKETFTDDDSNLEIKDGVICQKVTRVSSLNINAYARPASVMYDISINAHIAYHPFVDIMRKRRDRQGIMGLLAPTSLKRDLCKKELLPRQANELEINYVELTNCKNKNLVKEKFDFNTSSALGIYNWEIFYHIPFMIANHFYTEGNYDEALKWMHFIFDPREVRDSESSDKKNLSHFWKFKPFAENNSTEDIDDLMFDTLDQTQESDKDELNKQIESWSRDPFKPHNVARMRIGAYMKATVMRYVDIIIARGDQSFRVDTMESINEALQYYIIAAQILGKKPDVLKTEIKEPKTFEKFGSSSSGFSNALESLEEAVIKPENEVRLEKSIEAQEIEVSTTPAAEDKYKKNMVHSLYTNLHKVEKVYKLYFEIPKNDKLFGYWELVGDRLFKIRNSLNIDGVKRKLSLFAPPIDPGMLAAASVAGLDIKALVNGQDGPATHYRFNIVMGQALQLCAELKSLGAQLSAAYEKEDSESIADMRSKHEIILSEMVTRIKEQAIKDNKIQLEQLDKQKEIIDFRKSFYAKRKSRIKKEDKQLQYMDQANKLQIASQALSAMSAFVMPIPDIKTGINGVFGSPMFGTEFGGKNLAKIFQAGASVSGMLSSIKNHKASRAGILAGYERRQEEWNFQRDMAEKEYAPLEKQILSAQIRQAMAEYELENHKKQVEQSKEAYEVLQTKYTNKELYAWMRKEISQLHRYAYNMTYQLAKQAEKAYDFELNPGVFSQFISASHFDSKYEGLLAGEKLYLELKKMELAYQENNKRKYELTKHISLAMTNPTQLRNLQKDGDCEIIVPELLFDMDHPSHCNRRIKSVSLTIPCVTGPYTSVSAELSLKTNTFRSKSGDPIDGKPVITSIATSSAVNDNGMFQLNFNDERYLPFEGAGVNSEWVLSLPTKIRQFDYNTISDIILTIQYTAEKGSKDVDVEADLTNFMNSNDNAFSLFVDVKSQFPETYQKIKETGSSNIEISKKLFPKFLQESFSQNKQLKIQGITTGYEDMPVTLVSNFTSNGLAKATIKCNSDNVPDKIVLIINVSIN